MASLQPDPWPLGRYKLLEKSEVPRSPGAMRELLPEGAEILFDGMPGPHYEPLDDAAHAAVARVVAAGGFGDLDPVRHLDLTMDPDVSRNLLDEKLRELTRENAELKARLEQPAHPEIVKAPAAAAPPPPPSAKAPLPPGPRAAAVLPPPPPRT